MSTDKSIIQVAENIFFVDSLALSSLTIPAVSGIYILLGEEITLIESSITRVADKALEAIESLGFPKEAITRLILTHIHLDHAGAAGWLVKQLPWLQVYVQERGAKHLLNPDRLIQSAAAVYGSEEEVFNIHGKFEPLPETNVIPVSDLVIPGNNGHSLKLFSAPGHAPHHLCIYDEQSNGIFSGEAAGHYFPHTGELYPSAAPPSFSLEDALNTLDIMESFNSRYIFFSQFGAADNAKIILGKSRKHLILFNELIQKMMVEGKSEEEMLHMLAKSVGLTDAQNTDKRAENTFFTTLWGYLQYLQKSKLI